MKRIFALFLAVVLSFSLAACGGSQAGSSAAPAPAASAAPATSSPEAAQSAPTDEIDYPTKNITMIVPFNAGGSSDIQARLMQPYLQEELGVNIVIENMGGAGGTIGTTSFLEKKDDGYTVLFSLPTPIVFRPLDGSTAYTYEENLVGSAKIAGAPLLLIVSEDSQFENIDQLTEYLKANPDTFSYAQGGTGGIADIAMQRFLKQSGLTAKSVAFSSSGECYTAAVGGHVDAYVAGLSDCEGREGIRILLNLGEKVEGSALLEGIPNCSDLGLEGCSTDNFSGFYFKQGTDERIVQKFSDAIEAMYNDPEFQKAASDGGMLLSFTGADEFDTEVRAFIDSTRTALKDMGLI